jgi:hypothetical protein
MDLKEKECEVGVNCMKMSFIILNIRQRYVKNKLKRRDRLQCGTHESDQKYISILVINIDMKTSRLKYEDVIKQIFSK